MARHKSKFTNKKHSVGGVLSTGMGIFSAAFLATAIVSSFRKRGEGGTVVGSLALLALAFSVFGLMIGLLSYREIDRYTTFSFWGSLLCGLLTVFLVFLCLIGLS